MGHRVKTFLYYPWDLQFSHIPIPPGATHRLWVPKTFQDIAAPTLAQAHSIPSPAPCLPSQPPGPHNPFTPLPSPLPPSQLHHKPWLRNPRMLRPKQSWVLWLATNISAEFILLTFTCFTFEFIQLVQWLVIIFVCSKYRRRRGNNLCWIHSIDCIKHVPC